MNLKIKLMAIAFACSICTLSKANDLRLDENESYKFSLFELTGCSSDFQSSNQDKKWYEVNPGEMLSLTPTSVENGHHMIDIVCSTEELVYRNKTKTITTPSGEVLTVTILESLPLKVIKWASTLVTVGPII